MKMIFCSASKGGREIENEYTTEERAEADLYFNNYYIGCVERVEVDMDHFNELAEQERKQDLQAEEWYEPTQLQRYRAAIA